MCGRGELGVGTEGKVDGIDSRGLCIVKYKHVAFQAGHFKVVTMKKGYFIPNYMLLVLQCII